MHAGEEWLENGWSHRWFSGERWMIRYRAGFMPLGSVLQLGLHGGVAEFHWHIEVVHHEGARDGIQRGELSGGEPGFDDRIGVVGLLPRPQDGEYVGGAIQGGQFQLSRAG